MSTSKTGNNVGERIKAARKELGLSQERLANHLNISDKAISSYEVGRTTPSFNVLRKISKVVHKPISYFDDTSNADDIDLQIKIRTIERELSEIKTLLKKRQ